MTAPLSEEADQECAPGMRTLLSGLQLVPQYATEPPANKTVEPRDRVGSASGKRKVDARAAQSTIGETLAYEGE